MKLTFTSNVVAAAFFAAVHAELDDIDYDFDPCDLGSKRAFTFDISHDGDTTNLYLNSEKRGAVAVNTLAELEQAIAEVLALKDQVSDEIRLGHKFDESEYGNPVARDLLLAKDGTVYVGCKKFTARGAEMVVAAARRSLKGEAVAQFYTPGEDSASGRHSVYGDKGSQRLVFDDTDGQDAQDIIRLAEVRARLLQRGQAKGKPAPRPEPYRIFPAQLKVAKRGLPKPKKKSRK